uniref:Uncharacterized protein n=1 Tax=Avena sativa TaxID=4498 RepID=A0ACD5WYB1_AVESA
MAIDRQSERVILRRMYAFLKSRKLDATAYTLEHEARLRLALCHAVKVISQGRWRTADKYLSSFFGGKDGHAPSAALYVVRFERLIRALELGSHAWALQHYHSKVSPLVDNLNLPDEVAARLACVRALSCSDLATLRRNHPDDRQYRRERAAKFFGYYKQCGDMSLCTQDLGEDNLPRVRRAAALGLRRYARPRGKRSAESVAEVFQTRREFLRAGDHAPFLCF